jgi:hypothetical protein
VRTLKAKQTQLEKTIKSKQREMESTQKAVKRGEERIHDLGVRLEDRVQHIHTLEGELETLNAEITVIKDSLAELQRQLEEKKARFRRAVKMTRLYPKVKSPLLFVLSAKSVTQMYRRLRYTREYANYQYTLGQQIQERQAETSLMRDRLVSKRTQMHGVMNELVAERKKLTQEQLTKQNRTSFYPRFSPDGKELAFFEDRGTIRIINLASKQVRTVMDGKNLFSYSDGDIDFEWSPDSRWLLATYYGDGGYHHDDIALIDASGKQKPYNLTNSAYVDFKPHWALGGKAMLFKSNRRGYKNHGGHGYHSDFFIMFFDIDAYERFMMNKEEKALYDEAHKPTKNTDTDGDKKSADKKSADKKPAAEPLKFDLENCRNRVVRLTAPSTRLGDGFLTPKGDTLIYEAAFEDSYDLYRYDLLEDKNELLQKEVGHGDLQPDKKFKNLFVLSKGGIKKIEIAKGKRTNVDFEAQFNYRPYAERKHLFEHIWRQVDDKFYRADLHGVDWAGYKKVYEKFLPYINNEYDFRDMLA